MAGATARRFIGPATAPPQRAAPRARVIKDSGPIVVTDDWPERVPIGDAELRSIEGHLRKELDDLFGPLP